MLVTHRLTCPDRPQSKKSSLKNQPPERKLSYERIQVGDLVYRIKGSDGTTPMMHAELNCRSGDHSAVAITDESIQVSLICPIGKKRMKFPGRSTNCTHAQCFDLATFIEINKRSHDKMKCPLCGVQIDGHLFWMEVYIDTLMTKILVEADGDKVLLTKDGWKVPEESTGGNGTIVLDESSTVFDISGASTEHFDCSTTESPSTSDKNNSGGSLECSVSFLHSPRAQQMLLDDFQKS